MVDADALWQLEPLRRSAPTVLTPHEGELARLLGETSGWVAANRLEALARAAERFDCTVLLKGADTLVGAPGTRRSSSPTTSRRSRSRARETSSRASSPPSWRRASSFRRRRWRLRSRNAGPRGSAASGAASSQATSRKPCRRRSMHRSELTVDLGAIRRNAQTLMRALGGAELWAVVKADAYGHGATDVARAVLDGRRACALRRHGCRGARAAAAGRRGPHSRHGPLAGG